MTEQRIEEMSNDELIFKSYSLARGDMDHTFSFGEEETMEMTLDADRYDLIAYLIDNLDFVDDSDVITYKGYDIVIDRPGPSVRIDPETETEYGVHEGIGEAWERCLFFTTMAEAVEYIESEVA